MNRFFKQENKAAFWMLAPFICFAASVLAFASFAGLALFIVPGVLGFLGVAGLLECWIGLIRPEYVRRHCGRLHLELSSGLGVGAFASFATIGDLVGKRGADIAVNCLGVALNLCTAEHCFSKGNGARQK